MSRQKNKHNYTLINCSVNVYIEKSKHLMTTSNSSAHTNFKKITKIRLKSVRTCIHVCISVEWSSHIYTHVQTCVCECVCIFIIKTTVFISGQKFGTLMGFLIYNLLAKRDTNLITIKYHYQPALLYYKIY